MNTRRAIGLFILSAILLAVSFNYHWFWPIIFVALVPLFFSLEHGHLPARKIFAGGTLAGLIYSGWVMSWHWQVLPLDWAGVTSPVASAILVFFIWLGSTLVFSLGIGGFAWSFYKLKIRHGEYAVALWLIFDYLRAYALSLFWLGPGALIGPHWTSGFLGYALANNKILLAPAALGGVYLLTAMVVWINWSIYKLIFTETGKRQWYLLALIAPFILAGSSYYFNQRQDPAPATTLKLAIIKTQELSFFHITEEAMIASLRDYQTLLDSIKQSGQDPDVIIFPEDARLLRKLALAKDDNYLKNNWGERERLVIDSSRVALPTGVIKSKFFYLNTNTGATTESEKFLLVPHGEYLPYITQVIGNIINRQTITNFLASRGYQRGDQVAPGWFRGVGIGTLSCSEIASGDLYRELTNQGAGLLVNAASHSLFHGSRLLYDQTINMAKVRAVENNRYFVEASNFVPSYVISNRGELIAESSWSGANVIYATVPIITTPSIYDQSGNWILWLALLVAMTKLKQFLN